MYVLFSFLTPAAFEAAQRWGWKTVLFVSFSAWIIAQRHVRDMLVDSSKDLPFDLLAWQFLWVGGLFIGQRFLENQALLPTPHLLRPLFLFSAIAFFSGVGFLSRAAPIQSLKHGCSINGISDRYA
jgi:hypothetical protein